MTLFGIEELWPSELRVRLQTMRFRVQLHLSDFSFKIPDPKVISQCLMLGLSCCYPGSMEAQWCAKAASTSLLWK